jgi:hypothetical protein
MAQKAIELQVALLRFAAHLAEKAPGALASAFGAITSWLGSTGVSALGKAASLMGDALTAPFRAAFNAIRGFWNSSVGGFSFSVPDWIPGVGGRGWSIPKMHSGGMVTGGPVGSEVLRVLQVGERVESIADVRSGSSSGGGGNVINITINAPDARAVFDALDQWTRFNGPLPPRMVS